MSVVEQVEQEAVERASVPPAVHVALAELERAPGHQPRRQVRGVDLHVPVAVAVDADIGVGQQGLQSVAEWMRRGHASRCGTRKAPAQVTNTAVGTQCGCHPVRVYAPGTANRSRYGSATYGSKALAGTSATCTRSEEHTSELQSLMRISSPVFCLKNNTNKLHNKKT